VNQSRTSCVKIVQLSIARQLSRQCGALFDWVAAYTLSPPGRVARNAALRAPAGFESGTN